MPDAFPRIAHAQLLARLDAAPGALTVLTPNERLAQALARASDRRHLAAGETSWPAPDILSWSSWLERCHGEAAFSAEADTVPALASGAEEPLLWEDAIRASRWQKELLSVPATAALAAEAWALAHAWRIAGALDSAPGNEDAEAFIAWAAHYEKRTAKGRVTDGARLPAHVAGWLSREAIARPATLVLFAFELPTPQQDDLFRACARHGIEVLACAPDRAVESVKRVLPESPRRELEDAAHWARSRLERAAAEARATPRIAVIVPDLAERRAEVGRTFARAFAAGTEAGGGYFNLSAGEALSQRPLVDAALALIELSGGPVAYERASRLLRSPFLGAAETERGPRARLDAALRRRAPARLTLKRLHALCSEAAAHRSAAACPRLLSLLGAIAEGARESSRASPHEWARRFSAILDAAGWPGERTLDSAEFQTLGKFREALRTFAALGSVAPSWSASEARTNLARIATDALFQPASGEAPVQVLGILESAGLAFDHLWVSGLTEDAWPIAPRLHPLIAPSLQRRAGIPQASAERSLEVDRALTEAWQGAAPEMVFSSAHADGDRELFPSPLIASFEVFGVESLDIPDYASLHQAQFAAGRGEESFTTRRDDLGPALGEEGARGGTGILADQAACPFRAFAHHRLEARALERPEPGLDAMGRGQLLHAMMAKLWKALGNSASLHAKAPDELAGLIRDAAAHAVAKVRADHPGAIEERFAELERGRLEGIAREWLELERARPPFEVILREDPMTLSAGNLRLQGRIDRMDRLEGGGLAVIDYKSGEAKIGAWLGERPDDLQLPLYALAAEEDVRAVAFACLKVGTLAFRGLAREEGLLPNVKSVATDRTASKHVDSWEGMFGTWREEAARLGENFASGDAKVDPKNELKTCERCDLKPLCRVHERLGALGDDGAAADEDEE